MEALIGHLPRTHTQLYSEKADITSLSDYVSYANLPKNFKFLNLKYDTASSYDTEVLQYIESLEKAVFIIYCEHGSASMYMGFIVSDGKYGTVLRFEYNSLYINGCSGDAWAGWTKLGYLCRDTLLTSVPEIANHFVDIPLRTYTLFPTLLLLSGR